MAGNFSTYLDAGLTTELTTTLKAQSTTQDFRLWYGSPDSGSVARAASDPGVDQITITPTDSDPGTGYETTNIKLALTQAGLDTATAGAALDLGLEVDSGSANAVEFWVRVSGVTEGVQQDLTLSLVHTEIEESAA
jgi:hypothetical protein